METRQGDGTEALSQETESNGSATPKSRRHPLTLPPDWWESSVEMEKSMAEPKPSNQLHLIPPTSGVTQTISWLVAMWRISIA